MTPLTENPRADDPYFVAEVDPERQTFYDVSGIVPIHTYSESNPPDISNSTIVLAGQFWAPVQPLIARFEKMNNGNGNNIDGNNIPVLCGFSPSIDLNTLAEQQETQRQLQLRVSIFSLLAFKKLRFTYFFRGK